MPHLCKLVVGGIHSGSTHLKDENQLGFSVYHIVQANDVRMLQFWLWFNEESDQQS
jgi:hypothetical protein